MRLVVCLMCPFYIFMIFSAWNLVEFLICENISWLCSLGCQCRIVGGWFDVSVECPASIFRVTGSGSHGYWSHCAERNVLVMWVSWRKSRLWEQWEGRRVGLVSSQWDSSPKMALLRVNSGTGTYWLSTSPMCPHLLLVWSVRFPPIFPRNWHNHCFPTISACIWTRIRCCDDGYSKFLWNIGRIMYYAVQKPKRRVSANHHQSWKLEKWKKNREELCLKYVSVYGIRHCALMSETCQWFRICWFCSRHCEFLLILWHQS
jgi:hypothetical protein